MGRPFDRSGADDPDAGRGVYLRDPGNKIKVHNVNYHRSESDAEFVAFPRWKLKLWRASTDALNRNSVRSVREISGSPALQIFRASPSPFSKCTGPMSRLQKRRESKCLSL